LLTAVGQGRFFELQWCRPGILYKEIRSKKKEDEEKKQKKQKRTDQCARRNRQVQASDPRSTAVQNWAIMVNELRILTDASCWPGGQANAFG
jgi:hypothetical protein